MAIFTGETAAERELDQIDEAAGRTALSPDSAHAAPAPARTHDRTLRPIDAQRDFEQAVEALVEAAAWDASQQVVINELAQADAVARGAGLATDYAGGCASGDAYRWLAEAEARGLKTDGGEDPLTAGEVAVLDAMRFAADALQRIEMRAGEQAEEARQQAAARRLDKAALLAEARDLAAAGAGAGADR